MTSGISSSWRRISGILIYPIYLCTEKSSITETRAEIPWEREKGATYIISPKLGFPTLLESEALKRQVSTQRSRNNQPDSR